VRTHHDRRKAKGIVFFYFIFVIFTYKEKPHFFFLASHHALLGSAPAFPRVGCASCYPLDRTIFACTLMDSSLGSCDCSALSGLAQLLHFLSSASLLLSASVGSALHTYGDKISFFMWWPSGWRLRASDASGFLWNPFHPRALFLSCHLAYAKLTSSFLRTTHTRLGFSNEGERQRVIA
jgi:hypothetical protein